MEGCSTELEGGSAELKGGSTELQEGAASWMNTGLSKESRGRHRETHYFFGLGVLDSFEAIEIDVTSGTSISSAVSRIRQARYALEYRWNQAQAQAGEKLY